MKPFKLFSSVQPFDFIRAKKIYIRAAVQLHPCEENLHPCSRSTSSVQPFDFIRAKKVYIRVAVRLHPCNKNLHPCSRSQYPCRTAHRPVSHPFGCRAFRRAHGFRKERFRVRGHTCLYMRTYLTR